MPHFSSGHIREEIRVNKIDPVKAASQEMSQHIGFVFQDPESQFAAGLADRVVLLSRGEVITSGIATEVLTGSPMFAPQIARLFPNQDWLTVEDVLETL